MKNFEDDSKLSHVSVVYWFVALVVLAIPVLNIMYALYWLFKDPLLSNESKRNFWISVLILHVVLLLVAGIAKLMELL